MAKSSKGSAFERSISKFLSKWVQGTEQPFLFWRQISSGGLLKIYAEAAGKNLAGDIHSIHPKGEFLTDRFSLELKNGYPGSSFDKHLKYNSSDGILAFWTQCCEDAITTSKRPMLIYRKKGMAPWVAIDSATYKLFEKELLKFRFVHLKWPSAVYKEAYFFDMEEFFENITPDLIVEKCNILT